MSAPRIGTCELRPLSLSGMVVQYLLDLINLSKPGIIFFLLITTVCPMFLAAGGWFPLGTLFWTILGGALVSGSAGVCNCIYDRDIDQLMRRTESRALPQGRVSPLAAGVFALILGVSGLVIFFSEINALAAYLALAGHLFYVVVYTCLLKRHSAQNIVIGGIAGAFPPLVGWAAVTNSLAIEAYLLAAIIVFWTPPHFWALALVKNEDYRRARIPMMPLVAGAKKTEKLMLWYALSLLPLGGALAFTSADLSSISLVSFIALALIFCLKIVQLIKVPASDKHRKDEFSWAVFSFSLVYLAAFFGVLLIDTLLF